MSICETCAHCVNEHVCDINYIQFLTKNKNECSGFIDINKAREMANNFMFSGVGYIDYDTDLYDCFKLPPANDYFVIVL